MTEYSILEKQCPICLSSFVKRKKGGQKFCSETCAKTSIKISQSRSRKKYKETLGIVKKTKDKKTLDLKEYQANFRLNKQYGIDVESYNRLLSEQEHRCAICRKELDLGKKTHVDHKHTGNKEVRGILCSFCNIGLGMFKDSPGVLRLAAEYLEREADQKLKAMAIQRNLRDAISAINEPYEDSWGYPGDAI